MPLRRGPQYLYGWPNPTYQVPQLPIVATRAPTTADFAEIGQFWIDRPALTAYFLADVSNGSATWVTAPSGGLAAASFTINPGDLTVTAGNVDIPLGTLTVTTGLTTLQSVLAGPTTIVGATSITGNTILNGNLTVTGDCTVTGDWDITDTASIGLTSTNNAAGAITLLANGGVNETIIVQSAQGTGAGSITLDSIAGGITLQSALASADAINISATDAAGGVDIDAGTAGIIADTTGSISLDSTAASNFTVTGAFDLTLSSTAGSVVSTSAEAAVDAIRINASNAAGGIDIDCGTGGTTLDTTGAFSIDSVATSNVTVTGAAADLQLYSVGGSVVLNGSEAAADAITIAASDAAGGIDIDCGTGGATLDTTGAISLDSALSSNITVTGAAADLSLLSVGGSVIVNGSEAAADAIRLFASDAAGGIDADCGTGGATLDSTGAISLDSAAASNFTVTGAFDLTLSSIGGSVVIDGSEAAADAVQLTSSDAAGGILVTSGTGGTATVSTGATTIDAAGVVELNSSAAAIGIGNDADAFAINIGTGAAARTITIGNVTGATSVVIDAGTGAVNVGTSATAHTTTLGSTNTTSSTVVQSGTGDVIITSTDAITAAATGVLTLDAAGVLELNSSAAAIGIGNDADAFAINIGTGAAARTVTIGNVTGASSVVIDVGTGNCSIGTSATAHATQVGSTTAGSTLTLQTPAAVNVTATNGISVTAAGRGVSLPGGVLVLAGAGSPDTVVTAPIGSLFLRTDPAGAASRAYINTDGGTTWTNITCAA